LPAADIRIPWETPSETTKSIIINEPEENRKKKNPTQQSGHKNLCMVRNADKGTKLKDKKTPGKRKTLDKEKILRYDK